MDTIIYVIHKEIQSNTTTDARAKGCKKSAGEGFVHSDAQVESAGEDSVHVERFPVDKEFQILHLTVCETNRAPGNLLQRLKPGNLRQCLKSRNVLRDLTDCFPRLCARRRRTKRRQLTEQIQTQLAPLLDEWGTNACIYAKRLQTQSDNAKPDTDMGEAGSAWLPETLNGKIPEFQGYQELCWIRRILPYAGQEHFLTLGTTDCIGRVFAELAPRAKSLLWIVPDYTYKAQVDDIAEMLFAEYGLAVDLRFLPEGAVFARIRIDGRYLTKPLNVLDFTGEKYVPPLTLAPGSIWLDMASMEEKQRRIMSRRMAAEYISLRTLAEHPGRYGLRSVMPHVPGNIL